MEAITRKKEVDEMSKTLAKEFGNLLVTKAGPVWTLDASLSKEGWTQTTPGGNIFINRTFFDLAGMAYDDKTLFFEGAATQETLNPSSSAATAGNNAIVVDIMSNKPLTDAQASQTILFGNMEQSDLTFDQTIYMRLRFFNTDIDNLAGSFMILLSDNQLGSLEPTASDRIYCTRVVAFGGADGSYNLYNVRYLLRALAKEEDEYQYLMRLKRSYELQQRFDRD